MEAYYKDLPSFKDMKEEEVNSILDRAETISSELIKMTEDAKKVKPSLNWNNAFHASICVKLAQLEHILEQKSTNGV